MDPQISARFSLQGSFEPDDVTRQIGLQPTRTWRRGDCKNTDTECPYHLCQVDYQSRGVRRA